jgi:phage major head subunit gpT-like protein
MIELRSKWGELISGAGLQILEAMDQGSELYTPGIFSILQTDSSDSAQKHFTGKVSENFVRQKEEAEDTKELSRYKTYVTSVDYTAYAAKVEVSRENLMDRDFSSVLDEATDIGRAMNFSIDESGVQLFNGGFDTRKTEITAGSGATYRYQYYNDAVPTFSVQHPTPVPGQSAQSNASATNIALTEANLETARLALRKQQTDAGGPMTMGGQETLILPLALEKEGRVITESEKVSGSEHNDINTYKGMVNMTTSVLFDAINGGSDTAWYLVVPGATRFVHDTREAASPWTEVDEDKKTLTVGMYARWGNYTKDYRRSWASKGTGSGTYTA